MNKLIATTLENKVHLWDLREQHPKEGFASHSYAHDRYINFFTMAAGLNFSWLNIVADMILDYPRIVDFDANLYLCQ